MFPAYKSMKRAMLMVEIFEKIWTIQQYRKDDKTDDAKRHQKLAQEMLKQIKITDPHIRAYLCENMGAEEWN